LAREVFPQLSTSREQESLKDFKTVANGLIEQLENKTEFVNEQKENIKILDRNVQDFELFQERLALWTHIKSLQKKIFYGLKAHREYRRRAHRRKQAVKFMQDARKKKLVFSQWRNVAFSQKKVRLGKEMILSFKVGCLQANVQNDIYRYKHQHEDIIEKLQVILSKKQEELRVKSEHLGQLNQKELTLSQNLQIGN
jgi:hypothetical protein